jgi:hypothetical protein
MATGAGHAFLVIGLKGEDEPVSSITEFVQWLGIPIEVIGRGRRLRRAPSVVVRVPHRRVTEAILALELQGFADVVAYQTADEQPTAE